MLEIIFLYMGFTAAIGAHSISEEVAEFSPLWFLEENSLCLLSLVFIVVHVILSNKILRSYCLNDKNLTNNLMWSTTGFFLVKNSSGVFLPKIACGLLF